MKRIFVFLLVIGLLTGCAAPASPQPDSTQATDAPTIPTVIQTGLINKDGKTYYINADGSYAKGKVVIDGIDHFFAKTGEEVLVVNPWHFVPYDYSPDLVTFYDFAQYADGNVLDKTCIDPLLKILEDCQNAGHNVRIVSSYRRQVTQQTLYNNKVDYFLNQGYDIERAREEAGKIIAIPGTSEHQLGLAVDIIDTRLSNLVEAQADLPAQKWLMENSWRYGFILRYPKDKLEFTGITYEPWHYRYVGTELAQELYESGLTLEEYIAALTQ